MREMFGTAARSEPLICIKCMGAFPFFLSSDFSYSRVERVRLLMRGLVCICHLVLHVQVDVTLGQRNRRLFMLDKGFFYFPINLCDLSSCSFPCAGAQVIFSFHFSHFGGVLFVLLLLEKIIHTSFLITPVFTSFHILILLV